MLDGPLATVHEEDVVTESVVVRAGVVKADSRDETREIRTGIALMDQTEQGIRSMTW